MFCNMDDTRYKLKAFLRVNNVTLTTKTELCHVFSFSNSPQARDVITVRDISHIYMTKEPCFASPDLSNVKLITPAG